MAIKQLKRYDWTYQFDDFEKYFPFKVFPPLNQIRSTPSSLFKYYALSDKSIEAVEQKYLYASHPYQLNDLFDCSESLIEFDSKEAIMSFFGGIIPIEEIDKGFKEKDKEFYRKVQYNFNIALYSRWGLLSFTEDPLSIPMWSYYTMNQGFVVEFDYSKFGFSAHGPFQINYQDSIEPVSVNNGLPLCVLYQSNVKTKHWEHEKEWRLLPEKYCAMDMPGIPFSDGLQFAHRKFEYDISSIKKIILGNRFFDKTDKELNDNKDGTFQIGLKTGIDLKEKLLQVIVKNKIPTSIIVQDTNQFKLSESPVLIEDDGKISTQYISPIKNNR